ncbi:MAG: type II toxin-antitoxin system VapC family toxin [Hyphomicrobiaceae bacterium]
MLVLDTDHLTALDRGGMLGRRLQERLEPHHLEVCTTIVSVSEQLRGLLAHISAARSDEQLLARYGRLNRKLDRLTEYRILSWSVAAAERLGWLRRGGVRIGTMDLRIASIALANDAIVLSRNVRDFEKIPDLRVADWLA